MTTMVKAIGISCVLSMFGGAFLPSPLGPASLGQPGDSIHWIATTSLQHLLDGTALFRFWIAVNSKIGVLSCNSKDNPLAVSSTCKIQKHPLAAKRNIHCVMEQDAMRIG